MDRGSDWRAQRPMRAAVALVAALSAFLVAPLLAEAAECTNTWSGPESGKWSSAESWSAEHVPNEADVVCIPVSKTVSLDTGGQRAEQLKGSGALVISGGSLSLIGVAEFSNIGTLKIVEGGELGGTGELRVVDSFVADDGTLKGDAYTRVGTEATGIVVGGEAEGPPGLKVSQLHVLSVHGTLGVGGEDGELRVVEGGSLAVSGSLDVNGPTGSVVLRESASLANLGDLVVDGPEAKLSAGEKSTVYNGDSFSVAGQQGGLTASGDAEILNGGSLTVAGSEGELRLDGARLENTGEVEVAGPDGRLLAAEGAQIDNEGFFKVNAEGESGGLRVAASASVPHLVNSGSILKTQGTGTTVLELPIDNEATVKTETGVLELNGGGASGKAGKSQWIALSENLWTAQTRLVFADAAFDLGSALVSGEIQSVSGALLKADSIEGPEGSVWLYGGDFSLVSEEATTLGELGIASGLASLSKGAELSTNFIEVTDNYLEASGVEELEAPAELDLGADSTTHASAYVQSIGSAELRDGAVLNADLYIEGGSFTGGNETAVAGEEFFLWEGSFDAGASTDFRFDESYVLGEAYELGPNSNAAGNFFIQQTGSSVFDAGTQITAEYVFVSEGDFVLGEGSTATLDESFYQERGSTQLGAGAELKAGEYVYYEDGVATIGEGGVMQAPEIDIENGGIDVGKGALLFAGELSLWDGELSGPGMAQAEELVWWETEMTGPGKTEITEIVELGHSAKSCEKFTCHEPDPVHPLVSERELVSRGTFALGNAALALADGASLKNFGDFDASSETPTWGPQVQIAEGSAAAPVVVNRGSFEKKTGSGTTVVDVPFWNFGSIGAKEGDLDIRDPMSAAASEQYGQRCHCGDPVESASGNFTESQVDFAVAALGSDLTLARAYSAQAAASAAAPGIFGYGWTSSFEDHLLFGEGGDIVLARGDGSTIPFTASGGEEFSAPRWSQATLSGGPGTGYVFKAADQIAYEFGGSGRLQRITDRNGNETTLAYDEAGRLKTVSDPAARQISLLYNGAGFVKSAEDPMGHSVEYGYEGGDLSSVTLPGDPGPRWQFDYDASHRMTEVTDGRGGKTTNEYDGEDRVVLQTDPAERTLSLEYDSFHTRIVNEATGAVTDQWFTSDNEPFSVTRGYGTEEATTEAFAYDVEGKLQRQADGNGHVTLYTYNPAGDRTSVTDANENETSWEYNGTHDVVSETTPGGRTTTITRDGSGNPETISRPAPGEASQVTSLDYDALGQLESLTDPLERTWSYGYDGRGNRESETDPEGNERTWAYDEDSRVVAATGPRGNVEGAEPSDFTTLIHRDPQGRAEEVVDPLGHGTEYAYDANGNLESETDAKGHTTEFTYNAVDERTEVKRPSGAISKTEYDGAGKVIAQVDANEHATTYVRNVLGQPVEIIDALGRKRIQEFDPAGNLKAVTDPAERVTSYAYDPADRLSSISYSDETTPDASFEYDPDGNLTSMSDGSGESTYAYDQLGRLEEATNGHGDTVSYDYNLADEQEGIVYPNGKRVDQGFDAAGRLETVTDWLGRTTSFSYDPDSNLELIDFPSASGNHDEFDFDRTGRIASVAMKRGAESLAVVEYERDKLGQVEPMASTGLPGAAEESYEYDKDDRLVKAGTEAFEYDPADNPVKTPASINAFDAADQLETGTGRTYEYSAMGERVKATPSVGPATNYAYDQAERLTSVSRSAEAEAPAISEAFSYDGTGLMASRTAGAATSHLSWDTTSPLPLILDDEENSYVYGPGGIPIEQISSEEVPTYLHHDQLGSTRLLTAAGGEAAGAFTYGAYGSLAASAGPQTTALGFAGQYTVPQSGLQYLRARFYDPTTAQFVSEDPALALTGLPYVYANGNPLALVDPDGENPFAGAAAGTGAVCAATAEVPGLDVASCGAFAGAAAAFGAAAAGGYLAGSLTNDEKILGDILIPSDLAAHFAKLGAESHGDEPCVPSEAPNFDDPAQPPGAEWEWKGRGAPGSSEGSWFNPKTDESLHPDLDHGGEIGPHYDYLPGRGLPGARVFPDGRIVAK
jgi:RHS repeat-associated protein